MTTIRKASVAGSFYPRLKEELLELIHDVFTNSEFGLGSDFKIGPKSTTSRNTLGGVVPHAGYIYSASAAAHTLQAVFGEAIPDTVIILGTTHTGVGDIATMKEGVWETPLGNINVDSELSKILIDEKIIVADDSAFIGFPHGREHNIEVQIPLIQYISQKADKSVKIVPITIGQMKSDQLVKLATKIAEGIKKFQGKKDIVVLASSDMTHHGPKDPNHPAKDIEWQRTKDKAVMDAFQAFDWKRTLEMAQQTTVCGPQCIVTLMLIAQNLGYQKSKLLKYYTSFEKMGSNPPCDYSVGYFSGIISK